MKYAIYPLLLSATIAGGERVSADRPDLDFQKADARTLALVRNLLPAEIADEERYAKIASGQRRPTSVLVARQKVSASEPSYLFVEIVGGAHCGNVNCSMWGFEPTQDGWRKVFDSIGYNWTVLSHTNGAHHDISERFHDDAFEYTVKTFRWAGERYRQSASRDILRENTAGPAAP